MTIKSYIMREINNIIKNMILKQDAKDYLLENIDKILCKYLGRKSIKD